MTNPVLVEVTRGALVESRHRGALAVVDASGRTLLTIGDVAQPVFPRSAVKPMQALALVESGAADRYGFGNAELALACASHGGEPHHVETARRMLTAAGRSPDDLECGPQSPANRDAADALIRAGVTPAPIHNNCSGKHSGFICVAAHRGVPVAGYVAPDHPVQKEVTAILAALTDTVLDDRVRAVDGCSIPTYAIPLERLALGFARFISGAGLPAGRARSARRLFDACVAEPFHVGGTGSFVTEMLAAFRGRVLVKNGAEGVYVAAFPERGIGVAIKCDDGAGRAAEVATANVIDALLPMTDQEQAASADRLLQPVTSRRGARVGEVRLATGIAGMLRGAPHSVS
jgi:L-asparaginase II